MGTLHLLKKRTLSKLLSYLVIEGSRQIAFPMTEVSNVTWLPNLTRDKK